MRSPFPPVPGNHTVPIVVAVLLMHGLGLWALQSGLLQRAVEVVVPVEVLSEVIEPPRLAPPPPPPLPPPPAVRLPAPQAVAKAASPPTPPVPVPVTVPAPSLAVVPNPEPAPNAPTAIAAPPAPLPPMNTPMAPGTVAAAAPVPGLAEQRPPAASKVELPSSDAGYLQNPKPVYPAMSKRLNEQGTVLVRVLIGVDGTAQQAEIQQSSNFDRLDQAALSTVRQWRYVPGKRGGKPEAMWFTVPIAWVLK